MSKRARGSASPGTRPLPSSDDHTISTLEELKAELEYLLARKSKNPQELLDAAKYLKNAGLGPCIRRLDRIKEEELDEKIEIQKMLINDVESAFKKRRIEQQGSGAYTFSPGQSLMKVSFVVPSGIASLRQLSTAANCAPIVDVALIEALEYLGELEVLSNATEEELYSSLKRNVKKDPEEGVLRSHIADFLRSKLQSTLSSTFYQVEVEAPLASTKMDICIRPREHNEKYAPIVITIADKHQYIGSKEGQAVAYAQDMHSLGHPRVLSVVMYVDSYKIISFKAWGAYRLKSRTGTNMGESAASSYGYSEVLCADPGNAFSKLMSLFDWWIKNAKLLKDETTLPYCDVSKSRCTSILNRSTGEATVYKYYNIDEERPRETLRSPLLYKKFLDVKQKEDMKIYRIQEFRYLLKYKKFEGSHKFRNVGQIKSLIRSLRRMHERGYVHGDIRGSNMVVSNDGYECRLIDFDYSGREDEQEYPGGWNKAIDDGERHPNETGFNKLKKPHDIFALLAICRLYKCQTQDLEQKWDIITETYYNKIKTTEVTLEDIEKTLEEIPLDEQLVMKTEKSIF